jgi:hypothetical protein
MPSAADVARCDYCQARIIWTVTAATGARMAVNAAPDPTGNTAVYADVTGRLRSRALTTERPSLEGAEWQAMPHAATCTRPRPRAPRRTPTADVLPDAIRAAAERAAAAADTAETPRDVAAHVVAAVLAELPAAADSAARRALRDLRRDGWHVTAPPTPGPLETP